MKSSGKLSFGILDYAVALGMLCYAASSVIFAICLLKMAEPQELSFDLTGGGNLQAARMIAMCVTVFLCGFIAARYGKCHSLVGSMLLMAIGLVACAFTPSYTVMIFALILVGFSDGMLEGLLNPVIQELHPQNSGKYLNFLNAFWSIGVLATMIIGGDLLSRNVSWRSLLLGLALVTLIPMVLFMIGTRTQSAVKPVSVGACIVQIKEIVQSCRFWFFAMAMFLCGGGEGALTFWSASLLQKEFGVDPRGGGIGAACFSVGMIIGRVAIGIVVRQHQLLKLIIASGIMVTLICIVVPAVHSFLGICVVLFLAGLSTACFWPSIQSYSVDTMKADSTMLFIFLSLAGIPGFAAIIWVMGVMGDSFGLRASFYVVPMVFGLFLLLFLGELAYQRKLKKMDESHPHAMPLPELSSE